VIDLFNSLRNVAERHLADVQQLISTYLAVKDDLEQIPVTELLDRARDGLVTVLDVRPSEEYQSGHVSGAINIPLSQLKNIWALWTKHMMLSLIVEALTVFWLLMLLKNYVINVLLHIVWKMVFLNGNQQAYQLNDFSTQ